MPDSVYGTAEFSPDGTLRHRLDRWWADGPRALVCMANPSNAGADKNDPTVCNLIRLMQALGYPGFTVVNWLPYIATSPADLHRWRNQLLEHDGPEYRRIHELAIAIIAPLAREAAARFVAWGNLVPHVPHTTAVLRAMSCGYQHDLLSFGRTKDGCPTHPAARGRHRLVPGTPPVIWQAQHRETAHA